LEFRRVLFRSGGRALQVRLLPRTSCPATPWAPSEATPPAAHAPAAKSRRIRQFFVESCTSVVAAWPLAEPAFQTVQPLRRVPTQAAVKPSQHRADGPKGVSPC